ncbi:multidrug effflux MFS transporter [Novosphingobium sp.]|uniref:multidrug effflux MFS transporter n=1 Tax=Novosphingobium sp. TaxID=1874826 RepID=UPI0025E41992|nr:multidrug effflux MFS transporter [Novosphingobium sp.]
MGPREFVVIMAMSMALQALAIDAMLPALAGIAQDLAVTDPNQRQLIVGIFLIGGGVGALIPGSLADRYGRRPVLLAGLAIYVVLSLGCAIVTDFTTLLVLRAVQAIGSAGLSVLPSAIIRDRHGGDAMARQMSTITVIFMLVPMVAPSIGLLVLLVASWRWIFALLAVLSVILGLWVWLRLEETLDPANRQPIRPMTIATNMVTAASNRSSFGYVIGGGLILGALFGYVNCAQQLVGEHFGAGAYFPLIFGATALCMAFASFFNSRIVERFGARRVSHAAVLISIGLSLLQVWNASRPDETLLEFMPVIALNICMVGFIGANFSSIALQPFAHMAGAASSVQAFLRMLIGSGLGMVIGLAYDGTALPLALAFLACGLSALVLVLWSENGRLFRRINPRGTLREVPLPDTHC